MWPLSCHVIVEVVIVEDHLANPTSPPLILNSFTLTQEPRPTLTLETDAESLCTCWDSGCLEPLPEINGGDRPGSFPHKSSGWPDIKTVCRTCGFLILSSPNGSCESRVVMAVCLAGAFAFRCYQMTQNPFLTGTGKDWSGAQHT